MKGFFALLTRHESAFFSTENFGLGSLIRCSLWFPDSRARNKTGNDMPGQVLETSLIRPLSEFSLVFGFVAFSDFDFVYFFSFFFLHILFFPFGVPLLEINKFFYIARSAALTAFICKMSLYYDTKTIIMMITVQITLMIMMTITIIII